MEKLIYLARVRASVDGAELRATALDQVVPRLRDAGASQVSVHLCDDRVDIAGPMPSPGGELPLRAAVSLWLPSHDLRDGIDDAVAAIGERVDGYLVTESIYSEFGQRRGTPRDWPSGTRSPGLVTLATVHRNPLLDPRTFREFWYGHQSPMSEELQPRLRYVRNTVVHPVTPGAPPVDGIVVESWESEGLVADIEAFHLGDLENLTVMLDSVGTVFDMSRLRSIAMSEYLFDE
ncbi:MAG: hypothetical protein M3Y51_00270 [Actinomycetota bacterium]|nr:hypothetical protein [Actinomycetota bacterium]